MNQRTDASGAFVISLDFELFWGVRDVTTLERYGPNLTGARRAIPWLLELFASEGIHATWATVGFLCFDGRDDLLQNLPRLRPEYRNRLLSPYRDLEKLGRSESEDPHHFAPSLVRRIVETPGQELGTHTFSHYYCLEDGQSTDTFAADLDATLGVASGRFGVEVQSIVFPRNQYTESHLRACRNAGLRAFRGNQAHWLFRGRRGEDESMVRRGIRWLDHYVTISGDNACRPSRTESGMIDVPASRFLRPYGRRFEKLEEARLARIKSGLEVAARSGSVYHLWWHPHNFGVDPEANLDFVRQIVAHYRTLRASDGFQSLTMAEAVRWFEHRGDR